MFIVFEKEDGEVGLIQPILAPGTTALDVAQKDVPVGKPFLLIDGNDMPTAPIYHPAWEVDFSNPDGHGLGHDGWMLTKNPDYEA
jgi:hypothetical protein